MKKEIKDYVCFDLETTGFGKSAEIIEFGAVKVRDNEVVDKFSELVKPVHRIPSEITEKTGIKQSDVENCRSISEVLPDFLNFIGKDILVGHNIASFDIPALRRAIHNEKDCKFEPMYIDTYFLAKRYLELPAYNLNTVLEHYGIQNERAHRAFQDCEANNKLLQAMKADGIVPVAKTSCEYNTEGAEEPPAPKEHLEIDISDEQIKSVSGKKIVRTGEFEFGSREEVGSALSSAGALIRNSVSPKTDYLIVGSYGSDNWKFDNGGGKIKAAQELGVKILSEKAITDIFKFGSEEEMSEQFSLFGSSQNDTLPDMEKIINYAAEETGYKKDVFSIIPNKKNIGKPNEELTGYSLLLDKTLFAKTGLDFTKIQCSRDLVNKYEPKNAVEIKDVKNPVNFKSIKFSSSQDGLNYLRIIAVGFSKNYVPSERFGCCHLYEKCSDARRCLAADVFHARGCFYRDNLENGRIFYGKNANV